MSAIREAFQRVGVIELEFARDPVKHPRKGDIVVVRNKLLIAAEVGRLSVHFRDKADWSRLQVCDIDIWRGWAIAQRQRLATGG